jgi:hypothetical protein
VLVCGQHPNKVNVECVCGMLHATWAIYSGRPCHLTAKEDIHLHAAPPHFDLSRKRVRVSGRSCIVSFRIGHNSQTGIRCSPGLFDAPPVRLHTTRRFDVPTAYYSYYLLLP